MNTGISKSIWGIIFLGTALWATLRPRRDYIGGGLADYLPDSHFDKKSSEKNNELVEKKINPSGRCLYTMDISYRRGGRLEKKALMAEAFTMTEARAKFQNIINKNLRDATLESLHIGRTTC